MKRSCRSATRWPGATVKGRHRAPPPEEEMPHSEDGPPVEIVCNPHRACTSRMNVRARVFEGRISAGRQSDRCTSPRHVFDGRGTEMEIKNWLDWRAPNGRAKTPVFDSKTRDALEQDVTVGTYC